MTDEKKEAPFESWAVLELLGHVRMGGLVREVTLFGAAMCRIDVPGDGGGFACTQFVSAASIYRLTPCGEAEARAVAAANRPQPVTRWEMQALPAPGRDPVYPGGRQPRFDDERYDDPEYDPRDEGDPDDE